MERSQIQELHYITDMANVPSMLEEGILCHRLAERTAQGHVSVADHEVQARRAGKRIWLGRYYRRLHDYANLYIDARNAMLFVLLQTGQGDLTVLAIDPAVLDLRGVVIADRNAASLSPSFIRGAYVPDEDAAQRLQAHLGSRALPIRIHPWLLFGGRP
jgi:ssDNA thymidine ADP-ribosyltransferase, DarT